VGVGVAIGVGTGVAVCTRTAVGITRGVGVLVGRGVGVAPNTGAGINSPTARTSRAATSAKQDPPPLPLRKNGQRRGVAPLAVAVGPIWAGVRLARPPLPSRSGSEKPSIGGSYGPAPSF
jgi:hypothetical protein